MSPAAIPVGRLPAISTVLTQLLWGFIVCVAELIIDKQSVCMPMFVVIRVDCSDDIINSCDVGIAGCAAGIDGDVGAGCFCCNSNSAERTE
jgi:hypothetical protein